MVHHRFRSPLKAAVALLSIACFLPFSQIAVTGALAADTGTFETWPKKAVEPGVEPSPEKTAADTGTFETWPKKAAEPAVEPPAAKAGDAAGAKTASGISAGTWGWIAAGVAAVVAVVLIAGGSNGGSGTTTTTNH